MTEIPEDLLRRSAEAKAKALGLPVEQVLAEMKGEAPPTPLPAPEALAEKPPAPTPNEDPVEAATEASDEVGDVIESQTEPAAQTKPAPVESASAADVDALLAKAAAAGGLPEALVMRSAEAKAKSLGVPVAAVLADDRRRAAACRAWPGRDGATRQDRRWIALPLGCLGVAAKITVVGSCVDTSIAWPEAGPVRSAASVPAGARRIPAIS